MEPDFFDFGTQEESVPLVSPEDLQSLWRFYREAQKQDPRVKAIGVGVLATVCSQGANVMAVAYRCMTLEMWDNICRTVLEGTPPIAASIDPAFEVAARKWVSLSQHDGELDRAVFRVAATFPMKTMPVGVVRHDLPFDAIEFLKQVDQETAK